MIKHTPLPWQHLSKQNPSLIVHIDGQKIELAVGTTSKDNAAFIIRACNSYYVMRDVLDGLLSQDLMVRSECGGHECFFCGGDFSNAIGGFKHTKDCLSHNISKAAAIAKGAT